MAGNRFFRIGVIVLAAVLWAATPTGPCQGEDSASANYRLLVDVVGNSGGGANTSVYRLNDTAGQASPVGGAASGSYNLQAGFWRQAAVLGRAGQKLPFLAVLLGEDDTDNDGISDNVENASGLP